MEASRLETGNTVQFFCEQRKQSSLFPGLVRVGEREHGSMREASDLLKLLEDYHFRHRNTLPDPHALGE